MKSGFIDRLIDRLDKLDPKSLQTHFLRLVQEKGLLEIIFQSIQEGVIVVDGTGRLNYANKAAEKLVGFSFEMAEGRPVATYLRGIDWDRILKMDETAWSKLLTQEIEITYPEHRFVSFYVMPLSSTSKGDKGVVVILRDVTHDRLAEASLVESERLNAIKLLAAGVAHEVGNPLNALTIHLQLLEREIGKLRTIDRDNLKELAGVAKNEVSRLDLIITQFLRAIRPSQPKLTLSRIDHLLNETIALIKPEVENRRIQMDINSPEPLPRLRMDRDQIKQVFFNIIRNAFQAMPDGGRLTVSLFTTDRFLGVSFQDTGVGIKREEMSRIFEPYHTTKPSGSGLGLMIVQRIIQDHGGEIEVTSKPEAGTRFTILLPLSERRVRLLPRANPDVLQKEE